MREDLRDDLQFTYGYIVEEAMDTKRGDMDPMAAVFFLIADRYKRMILTKSEVHNLIDAAMEDFA